MSLTLCSPSILTEDSWTSLLQEFRDNDEPIIPYALFGNHNDFLHFLVATHENAIGINLKSGFVPNTLMIIKRDDERIIGAVDLRFHLNQHVETFIGHIGYGIRPSERLKGYGTLSLSLALEKFRSKRINEVILTCGANNIASQRVILKNNGQFVNSVLTESGITYRYRILL